MVKRVAVTGAAGQIGYSLVPRIAAGEIFGPDVPVILQCLELTPALQALQGASQIQAGQIVPRFGLQHLPEGRFGLFGVPAVKTGDAVVVNQRGIARVQPAGLGQTGKGPLEIAPRRVGPRRVRQALGRGSAKAALPVKLDERLPEADLARMTGRTAAKQPFGLPWLPPGGMRLSGQQNPRHVAGAGQRLRQAERFVRPAGGQRVRRAPQPRVRRRWSGRVSLLHGCHFS